MLDIKSFTPSNTVAPDVYITSVELVNSNNSDKLNVYYRLYDSRDPATGKMYWSDEPSVIQSLNINLTYEETGSTVLSSSQTHIVSLSSLKTAGNGIFEGMQTFNHLQTTSSFLKAYCGNSSIRGIETQEQVFLDEKLAVTGSYLSKMRDIRGLKIDLFGLIKTNKIKDPRLLKNKKILIQNNVIKDNHLYVSYTTDKRCKLGVIFDLNQYLLKHSENFKLLESYDPYRKYVLETSYVDLQKSQVFLIDTTDRNGAEISYPFTALSYKVDDKDSKYILTFDLKDLPAHKYFVKLKLVIFDNSTTFFNDTALARLDTFRNHIETYKNALLEYGRNKHIKDINQYYFKNVYDKKVPYLKRGTIAAADTELYSIYADAALEIAELTYIFNSSDIEERLKLYTSILHPLTTSPELLEGLLKHIDNLYLACHRYSLIDTNTLFKSAKDDKNKLEMKFGSYSNPVIDMTYDAGFGYEVINTDSYEARLADTNVGFYKIIENSLQKDLTVRKNTEAAKYFSNPSVSSRRDSDTFSISMLDLGDYKYNFVPYSSLTPAATNEAYVYLKETYRMDKGKVSTEEIDYSFTYNYGKIGTIIYDLSSKGVSIENISNRNNGSNNNLQANTIFDPINSTKDLSLKYIVDTGVQKLYFLLDDIKYTEFGASDTTIQANASRGNTQELSYFPITDAVRKDPELKAKQILTYDCIFKVKQAVTGSNYSLYQVDSDKKNPVFNGIRSFNDHYLVESKLPAYVKVIKSDYNLLPDFLINTPAEALLRNNTVGPQVASADI